MARQDTPTKHGRPAPQPPGKSYEVTAFIFLAVVLFPLLSIALVGGFGFAVWMQHLLFGPPGAP